MTLAARLAAALQDPRMQRAAATLGGRKLDVAERALREVLRGDPTNVAAIRMLAEVAARIGRYRDAERLLARCLELAPDFHAARANYVTVLHRQSKFAEALAHADQLIRADPADLGHHAVRAAVLVRTGAYDEALEAYDRILSAHPWQPRLWISRGHVLKTVGRTPESIDCYRKAIEQEPTLGDAWWSLANLKTLRFDAADLAAMTQALAEAPNEEDLYHLHFALGRAYEDFGEYAMSFAHYAQGNALRRAGLPYNPDRTTAHVDLACKLLTSGALACCGEGGCEAPDPIFIVGLPRAGSTLLEQILATHSEVEGTMELPDIGMIAADLAGRDNDAENDDGYLPRLLALSPDERRALGERYLERTRIQRKTQRPRFIDKMPNNWAHIGLIHLILPRATIIDARRQPMANCFSAFKQHFSRGQGFTYDLGDLGRYWCDYARMMAHCDAVLPGRVLRVDHETLLARPEPTIRAILAHAGLSFQPACLTPERNTRPVRTASSEQVRRPIARSPDESWRNYANWLGELRESLGDFAEV